MHDSSAHRRVVTGVLATAWLALAAAAVAQPTVATYTNPLDVTIADPAVLLHEGIYYLTGTGFSRHVSTDLVHWQRRGVFFRPREDSWLGGGPWAAELHEKNGRFYYIFCCPGRDTGRRRSICLAVADDPMAAFEPLAVPMWEDQHSWIDPHIFADNDGRRYLYVTRDDISHTGRSSVFAAPLTADLTALGAEPRLCLSVSQAWEHGPQEGMTVIRHGGHYYMTYSSNGFGDPKYSVGYAVAPAPLGPWTKAEENPILMRTASVSGPGHNGVAVSPDGSELFAVYHTHQTREGGGRRQLAIDRLRFVAVPGSAAPPRLVVDGPTSTPQPFPAGAPSVPVCLGRDDFDGPDLNRDRWVSIWDERSEAWRIHEGALVLRALPGDVHRQSGGGHNIFLQHATPAGDWTIRGCLDMETDSERGFAFITVWQDCENYIMLKKAALGGDTLEAAIELNGVYTATYRPNPFGRRVVLAIERRGGRFHFGVSEDGTTWRSAGAAMTAEFTQVKVGFGAFGTTPQSVRDVAVDWFELVSP